MTLSNSHTDIQYYISFAASQLKHCNKIFLCNNPKHIQNFSRNIKPKATEARLRAVVLEEMQTDYFAFA